MKTGLVTMSMLIGLCGGVSLFAGCADGGPSGSGFADPGTGGTLAPAGEGFAKASRRFAGRCELEPASSPRDLGSSCAASDGDARAQVVGARVLGLLGVSIEDTGDVHSSPGVSNSLLTASAAGLLSAGVVSASASSSEGGANASSSVAGLNADVLGIGITADVVESAARASCGAAQGGVIITNLKIAGVHVDVTGTPNTTIAVGTLLRVVLNEQTEIDGGVLIRAIHITALDGSADVSIALSKAAADATCCAPATDAGPSDDGGIVIVLPPIFGDGGILPPILDDGGVLPPILDDGGILPPILEDGGLPPIFGDGGLPPILGDGGVLPPILGDGGRPPTTDSGAPPGSDAGPPKPGTPCNDDTDCGDHLTCVGRFL